MSALALAALADRIEREGPSRELDCDVALACGWTVHFGDNWIGPRGEIVTLAFTSSIDAAATLMPVGFAALMAWSERGAICNISRLHLGEIAGQEWFEAGRKETPSPAAALCAACLRARAALLKEATDG